MLAVNLETIDPWRYGFSGILPGIGPYGDSSRWDGQCAVPRVQVIEHLPGPSGKTRDGKGRYSDKLTWDLEPFCGTLATAPEREVFTSLLGQGPFGGNIDCRDVAPGHTILLNSYHEGGLLYIGDIHGGQGDTEYTGIADETRATVQLNCSVIKNKRMPTVRIVKPESIVGGRHQPADGARGLRRMRQHDRLAERGLRHQAAGQLHPHVLRPGVPHPDVPDGARNHHRARRRRGVSEASARAGFLDVTLHRRAARRMRRRTAHNNQIGRGRDNGSRTERKGRRGDGIEPGARSSDRCRARPGRREGRNLRAEAGGPLDEAKAAIEGAGGEVFSCAADMSRREDVERFVNDTAAHFGRLDILVNNAGDAAVGRTIADSDEVWEQTYDINLWSAVRATRSAVPLIREQGGGSVINVASVSGHSGLGGMADYNSAKAAMLAMTKTLAQDLGGRRHPRETR